MGRTVEELLTLSSFELTYWIEHFYNEPWGCEIENWRMGQTNATIVNVTPRGRGAKVFQPSDFYSPAHKKRDEGLTPEQRNFVKRRKKAMNKSDAAKGKRNG